MSVTSANAAEQRRPARVSGIDKIERRRVALAESALKTLDELGYARTSLREIANNSEFSHGVVHYYFRDKTDLISYCVRHYKTKCAQRYDEVVESATSADELAVGFLAKLTETLVEETPMHRLWYDPACAEQVRGAAAAGRRRVDQLLEQMIWRILTRYAELVDGAPTVDPPTAYALLDGLFEQAVVGYTAAPDQVTAQLADRVGQILPKLITVQL